MNCKACGSDSLSTFNGEVALHSAGLEGLDEPIVFVFPKVLVKGSPKDRSLLKSIIGTTD